ncbi:putative maspardin, alpha/Beta hydrolase [Medicago truncatula]|uniref:Maspardin n=2 Tax=Medicago truncatula TaxID=3880 RepID=A0A072UPA4_MEDTR|nr:maspardin [Medicago truncatula]KEH31674.1 esterase/lipase/thioesterase family protein [Medicago truncatula]RHN63311.1 putative maspardin, alpha/Beta hydrolase [Medicago truncatula]
MKGAFSAPGDYVHFKSQVPLHKIPIGTKQWRYYDFGPKVVPPLICLPGTAGTADVYYKQIMSLSIKGYRVISVDIPRVWHHTEWIQAFEKFLDAIDVHHVHLYGTSLGGFLAQLFAQHRPRRVRSLVLSNSFLETRSFSAAMPWAPIVSWTPSFLLKRYVLTGIRDGPHEPFIADSVDFVVSQVETLSREDLASRMSLTTDDASVEPLLLSDSFITIMDTNDYCAIPHQLKEQLSERYPEARRASLKTGGDFPFLSRPDEVNLHLQLHLRRVGVEARPDLVHGIPKGDIGGSPSKENDDNDSDKSPKDDTNKDDRGGSENPSTESDINPTPESSESHNLDNQPVESSECCSLDHEIALYVFPSEFTKEMPVVPRETSVHFVWEYIVLFHVLPYISLLYITILNYSFEFRQVV